MIIESHRTLVVRIIVAVTLLLTLAGSAILGPANTAWAAGPHADTGTGSEAASSQWLFALGLALVAGSIAFAAATSQRRSDELETDDR